MNSTAGALPTNNVTPKKQAAAPGMFVQDAAVLSTFQSTTASIVKTRWQIIRILMGADHYKQWQKMLRGTPEDLASSDYQAYYQEYEDAFSRATAVEESTSNFQIRQVMNYEKGDFGFGNVLLFPHQLEFNMHHQVYVDKQGVMRDLVLSNETTENDMLRSDVVMAISGDKDQIDNNQPVDNASIVEFNKQLTKIVLYQQAWFKNLQADLTKNGG